MCEVDKANNKELFLKRLSGLRNYVKESLWELGYGSNQHLHLLHKDVYFENRAKERFPYLFKIIEFYYQSLNTWEKRYFVNEVLEKGEHYLFWHNDLSLRTYSGFERRALTKIREGLFNETTPF